MNARTSETALSVFRADIGKATGLGEDAPLEAIAARLTDTDKLIQEKTTAIQTERDEAVKRAESMLAERKAEKLEAAIDAGLRRSGVKPECLEDARTILRGALEVNEKGEVVTKTAPNVVPGQSVEFFTVSQLRQMRPHYCRQASGAGLAARAGEPTARGISRASIRSTRTTTSPRKVRTSAIMGARHSTGRGLASEVASGESH